MPTLQITLAAMMPFVAALHRYAVAYGFHGVDKAQARHEARNVLAGVSLFGSLPTIAYHLFK